MTRNRMSEVLGEVVQFGSKLEHWTWETLEELLDIAYDLLARLIELVLALMNLIFHVVCFLRDLCIGTIQTFANIFHGFVKIVSNINCEEIEDFAAACIVVILWMGLFKFARNFFCRYHGDRKTDVGASLESTNGTQSSQFEWANQRTSPNNNKDEPERLCQEVCSDQRSTIKQSNQRYKKILETESDDSD